MSTRPNPYDEGDKRRAQLKADVALMRELGVAKWGEIVLGPAPGTAPKERTPEELLEHIKDLHQRQLDVLFGASSTRPRVMPPVGRRGPG